MTRFSSLALVILAAAASSVAILSGSVAGCSSSSLGDASGPSDAGSVRRDAAPVDPTEAGLPLEAGSGPPPSCEKYCTLVMANCEGEHAQYGSTQECLAFCGHLPLAPQPGREPEKTASVACRQYWADGPARTSPGTYCLAAGPFGGNTCADRCTAFCGVILSACAPDGGTHAYGSQPECATACAGFSYRDAGADGGGEGPFGPQEGDTLNCRLYWLRVVTTTPEKCAALSPANDVCAE